MTTSTLQPETATSDIAQDDETSAQIEAHLNGAASTRDAVLEELIETDARCGMQNYGRLPVAFVRGEGARLWDTSGKEYLDFLGGIAVVTVGHCHPKITAAIAEQAATLLHTSNIYYIEPQVRLAEKLGELSGGMRAFFCNSGAEANEAAIKIARKYASTRANSERDGGSDEKYEIITLENSFHGRTLGALAATGQPKYQEGFGPRLEGFHYVPRNDCAALEAAVSEKTCAIMMEPIFGESGVLECSDEFLQRARELCDEHEMLLIFDDVQCGIGRTGTFFGSEHSGVVPDVVTLAKGLGNGVPIGALLARENVAEVFVPGTHGCTFGGNFLSCAAALATLRVLADENLMNNARDIGNYLREKLKAWGEESGGVKEVRGRGLMIGVELNEPVARDIMKKCLENGLVLNAVGDTILRLLPPLCITRKDADEAVEIIRASHATL